MSDTKLCKDCRWIKNKHRLLDLIDPMLGPLCTRPTRTSLVDGKPVSRNMWAEVERQLDGSGCGEAAIYWEPK